MTTSKTINAWLSTPNPHLAEVFAKAGFDAVTVDVQHGLHDYSSAVECFRAIALHGALLAPPVRHHTRRVRARPLP